MFRFDQIIGQKRLKEYCNRSISNESLPHAILISGEKGSGKKSFASAFAAEILCENRQEQKRACLCCHACRQVMAGSHPDLIYIHREKNSQGREKLSYGVEDIRLQLNDTVATRPYSAKKKLYIIPEAERLTVQAQNALLKTLEEPPVYIIIVLLCSNEDALLDTIKSRCVRFRTELLSRRQIEDYLFKQGIADQNILSHAISYAGGNLGRAIEYTLHEDLQKRFLKSVELFSAISDMPIYAMGDAAAEIKKEYEDLHIFTELMRLWYKDVLAVKVSSMAKMAFQAQEFTLYQQARAYKLSDLERIFRTLDRTEEMLRANVNAELLLRLLLMECTLR